MAKPSDILGAAYAKGTIDKGDMPYAVWDTTQGLTEERRNANIGKILGNSLLLEGAEYNPDATVPSLADVVSFYGLKNSKDKSAVDKFLEQFPSKVQQWKKLAESDPKWGKSGWETIKQLYQQASMDKMAEDIRQGRRDIATGKDEKGLDWLATKAANIMFPRATEAVAEGRDPSGSEWARDVAANAAYAVPVSRIIGGATKAAPVFVRGVSQGAGQFAAPAAVATMDNIADDSRDAEDWATDVAVGGMTNLGVNKVLGPWLAGKLGALSGNVSRRGGMAKIRDILEGSPSPEQKAADLVSGAKGVLESDKRGISAGLRSAEAPATREALAEAQKILNIASTPSTPMLNPNGSTIINKATGKPLTGKEALAVIENQIKDEYLARDAEDVLGSVVQQANAPHTAAKITAEPFRKGAADYKAIFLAHPELKSMFFDPAPFLSKKVTTNLPAMLQTYAVNQAGSSTDKAADIVGNTLGIGGAKEIREKNAERKAKAAHKADITAILGGSGITDEDTKWLSKVRKDPKILQFGDPDDPEGFKRWLLERGADMLRGTPMYRPAWKAE